MHRKRPLTYRNIYGNVRSLLMRNAGLSLRLLNGNERTLICVVSTNMLVASTLAGGAHNMSTLFIYVETAGRFDLHPRFRRSPGPAFSTERQERWSAFLVSPPSRSPGLCLPTSFCFASSVRSRQADVGEDIDIEWRLFRAVDATTTADGLHKLGFANLIADGIAERIGVLVALHGDAGKGAVGVKPPDAVVHRACTSAGVPE
jgi:hypothetical protein